MKTYLAATSLLAAAALAGSAHASAITINFEGIAPYNSGETGIQILDYYNGGTASNGASGTNFGVSFTSGAELLCLNTANADCSNTSKGGLGVAGSQLGAMFFEATSPYMNVAAGFDTGFSFAYTNPYSAATTVTIFDGLNGTGNILATLELPNTPVSGCDVDIAHGANYCPFANASLAFSGTAKSVLFGGQANRQTFDDFTFGSTTVGGAVPEPATWAMMIGGIGFAGGMMRRRYRKSEEAFTAKVRSIAYS
jgi:hypothetical protein